MKRYRIYVEFKREDTLATHFLAIQEMTIEFTTEYGDILSVHSETYNFLRIQYPDREIASIRVYAL